MARTAARTRFRRSACLVLFFEGDALQCRNYLTGHEVAVGPALMGVLDVLTEWRTVPQACAALSMHPARVVRRVLSRLVAATLVIKEHSEAAARENALEPWRDWGIEARFFHFTTKPTHRTPPLTGEASISRMLLERAALPPAVKKYRGAPRIALPSVRDGDREFPTVLLSRRTHRRFGAAKVPLADIATLLRLTWGFSARIPWPGLGTLPVKTSPSGGARHPLEVYVAAARVSGLRPGLYHYRPDTHVLECLRGGMSDERLVRFCGWQTWVGRCAALFIMTAAIPRLTWRYQQSRAYRVLLLEAGHFGQTFCLTASWLGLAPFCTAALADEDIERTLGIDGAAETVVYATGVGMRAR